MSRLTVTEKEHWKSRIEHRLNKAIQALEARDPTLMSSIEAKAELKANEALGTADTHARIEAIKQQRAELEADQKQLQTFMYRHALGKDAARPCSEYQLSYDFSSVHRKQKEQFEEELLNKSSLGREILKLRSEKDALLDTVWLATSSAQIRDLWSRVSVVLGEGSTPLQQQILAQDINSPTEK